MSVVGGFFRWWIGELRGMLPAARHDARLPVRRLLVALRADGIGLLLDERGRSQPLGIHGVIDPVPIAGLAEALRRMLAGRRRLPIGIRVRADDCFVRTVDLPAAAQRDFERMLWLDLEHTTPLKARDVLSAHIVDSPRSSQGMVRVRHLVLKSRTIEPVVEQIRAAGFELSAIDCWNAEGTAPLPVNFLAAKVTAPVTPQQALGRGIAVLAGMLALSALAIVWGKQTMALASLTAETSRLQETAGESHRSLERARTAGAEIELVRRLKAARLPATLILEEVTRLLPDTAWLQEFRLDNDAVEIAGLAASASSLLPEFEHSALFHETMFTAPLRLEAGENRERFRLRTRLRPAPYGAGAKRPEAKR